MTSAGSLRAQLSPPDALPVVNCDETFANTAYAAWAVYEGQNELGSTASETEAARALPDPFPSCRLPTRVAWTDFLIRPIADPAALTLIQWFGFRARAYRVERRRTWVLSFRGTAEGGGAITDVRQILWDGEPVQYAAARRTAIQFARSLAAGQLPGRPSDPVVLTGHSLGGALAAYASQYVPGATVRTFNSAQLSYDLRDRTSDALGAETVRRFRNYRIQGDVVSASGPGLLGPIVSLPLPPGAGTRSIRWPHGVAVVIRAVALAGGDPNWRAADRSSRPPSVTGVIDALGGNSSVRSDETIRAHSMTTVLTALTRPPGDLQDATTDACIATQQGRIAWLVRLASVVLLICFAAPLLGLGLWGGHKLISLLILLALFVLVSSWGGPVGGFLFLAVVLLAPWRRVTGVLVGGGLLVSVLLLYFLGSRAEFGTTAWCALTAP